MSQQSAPNVIVGEVDKLQLLQQHAMQLELRVSDLKVKGGQLNERAQSAAPTERSGFYRQMADIQHDQTAAEIELRATNEQIANLQRQQIARAAMEDASPAIAMVPPPANGIPLSPDQFDSIGLGAFLLMIPIVLAFARRLWVRGGRMPAAIDIESSPRLQRLEQAVESIAIEVERISEGQRFTTKLLTERQNERLPAPSVRREPGSITPH